MTITITEANRPDTPEAEAEDQRKLLELRNSPVEPEEAIEGYGTGRCDKCGKLTQAGIGSLYRCSVCGGR